LISDAGQSTIDVPSKTGYYPIHYAAYFGKDTEGRKEWEGGTGGTRGGRKEGEFRVRKERRTREGMRASLISCRARFPPI
jgi:hypothetical protein